MQYAKQLVVRVIIAALLSLPLTVCGSSKTNNTATLGVTSGAIDAHCVGVPPQEANSCNTDGSTVNTDMVATDGNSMDGNAMDANAVDGNTMTNDYGDTMYNNEGDDDDCKYHVQWSMSSVTQSSPVTFTVSATRLVENTPLTGATTRAEVFLDANHPAPNTKPAQSVVENPPGTYTISPVVFDASGKWTVRFHFYEQCDDTQDNSEHGHAAFYVTIP